MQVNSSNIVLVAASKQNTNCMMTLHFLHQFIELLRTYSANGEVNEAFIKSNFCLVYELLDEVMDYGIPQLTDASLLKEFIRTGSQNR